MTDNKTTELREQLVESLAATAPTEAAQEKVPAGQDLQDMAEEMGVAATPADSMLARVRKGVRVKAPRLCIYGPPGIGKTTFAASAPKPIIILTEDGFDRLHGKDHQGRALVADSWPVCRTFGEVSAQLDALLTGTHDYKSIVLDGLDGLQALLFRAVADEAGKDNIGDIGFFKGYSDYAPPKLRGLLDKLDRLNDERGMAVILIAHSEVIKVEPPDSEPFDQYALNLHKHLRPIIERRLDAIFIAKYVEHVTSSGEGNQRRTRGIGDGDRVLYTQQRPAWIAKNPWGLPFEMKLEWSAFMGAFVASLPKPAESTSTETPKA